MEANTIANAVLSQDLRTFQSVLLTTLVEAGALSQSQAVAVANEMTNRHREAAEMPANAGAKGSIMHLFANHYEDIASALAGMPVMPRDPN